MNSKSLYLFIGGILFLAVPSVVFGQNVYKPLIAIPNITDSSNFGQYINALYSLSISIAALMAVIKIIIAGVKYMLSDVVTSKTEAINDIRSSVIGLIIVISAVLILTEINPKLVETEVILTPVKSAANAPGVAVAGNVETGNGYTSAPMTQKDFEATCESKAGSEYRVADGRQICSEPLPDDLAKYIENTFGKSGIDIEGMKKRWQLAHYPRLATNKHPDIIANEKVPGVFIAVEYSEPIDFLDRENNSVLPVTCRQYAQATGQKTKLVGDLKKGYLACVPAPVTAVP